MFPHVLRFVACFSYNCKVLERSLLCTFITIRHALDSTNITASYTAPTEMTETKRFEAYCHLAVVVLWAPVSEAAKAILFAASTTAFTFFSASFVAPNSVHRPAASSSFPNNNAVWRVWIPICDTLARSVSTDLRRAKDSSITGSTDASKRLYKSTMLRACTASWGVKRTHPEQSWALESSNSDEARSTTRSDSSVCVSSIMHGDDAAGANDASDDDCVDGTCASFVLWHVFAL